jgi:Ty3 transposon capsid-like protein
MTFQPTPTVETALRGLDTESQEFIQTILHAARSTAQRTLVPQPILVPQPSVIPLKSAKPETYHGVREAPSMTPDTWLFQMKQYIELQQHNPDYSVRFAATFLQGNALLWWRSLGSNIPTTWDTFSVALSQEFQPIDATRTARNQLANLFQTHSVTEYTAAFRTLALSIPDLSPAETLHRYIFHLKPKTRLEVEIRNPMTLEEATHIANLYDTITFANKNSYQVNTTHLQANRTPTLHQTSSTTTAMDLSAVASLVTRRLPKLTPAEYDHLKATGGCFRCRQKGHLAQNCTTYKNRVNALSTVATTNAENTYPQ